MSILHDPSKTIERRIGEEICRFANGSCDCRGRDRRLYARVEAEVALIMRLAAQVSNGRGVE